MTNMSFEWAMSRLDTIAAALQSEGTTLEQSLSLYAEAAELLAFCNGKLGQAKKIFTESEKTN